MKIISHRGNLNGKDISQENNPLYIIAATELGFDVEVDVWIKNNEWFLGHDEPKYKIEKHFLYNDKFWCHAKNKDALKNMLDSTIHCFWHETDKITLTSKGIPWCYSGNYLESGIVVELEIKKELPIVLGVCTDYPSIWE